MAILSYIFFFIPLITGAHKTSPFLKFHVNQGAIVCIGWYAWAIISIILSAVIKVSSYATVWGVPYAIRSVTPGWLTAILLIINLGFCAFAVIGIINAANGKTKELPVVGKLFTLFK